jgi:uncharacterized protein (UPF0147 family)
LRLLNSLFDESLRMSPEVRQTASYLSERWTFELLNEQVASLSEEMRFDEATALLDETLNDENLSSAMRRAVTRMRDSVVAFRRMDLARDAIIDGDIETGRQILESLAGDNNISPTLRSEARQWLNDLAQ